MKQLYIVLMLSGFAFGQGSNLSSPVTITVPPGTSPTAMVDFVPETPQFPCVTLAQSPPLIAGEWRFCGKPGIGVMIDIGSGYASLQGAPGPVGPKGATGATGATGPIGPAGAKGATGATGAAGPQGVAGTQGPQGPQGIQGVAGANGLNGKDGASGQQGQQGPPGIDGALGAKGDKGDTGPQGAPGPSGSTSLTSTTCAITLGALDLINKTATITFGVCQ